MLIGKFVATATALVALTTSLTALPVATNAQGKITTTEKYAVRLPSNIDFSWAPDARKITVKVSTGCQSSSLRPASDQTDIKFDRAGRKISIKGGFIRLVGPGDRGRVVVRDCRGAKTRVVTFNDVDYGDLEVIHQNKPLWTVHLNGDAIERQAKRGNARPAFSMTKDRLNHLFKSPNSHAKSVKGKVIIKQTTNAAGLAPTGKPGFYDGFRKIRVAPGLATSGQFIDVLMPFLQGHPDSIEGNQAMELKIWKHGAGYRVDLIKTGYPDDSITGEHYRGSVIRTSNGAWELLALAVKDLCARGDAVGGTCP
ncbi:hypothetical protein [uncultured Roseibium sp.]|uniref:hypothetical protein n=1 Tax=uncultured Roseibium sp. TaxID=1936171 RepID=UPI003216EF4F